MYNLRIIVLLTLATFLALASTEKAQAQVRIIDGDTIEVGNTVYRIEGIDAPEVGQKCDSPNGQWNCGKAAVEALAEIVGSKHAVCVGLSEDGYGRTIANCKVGDLDLGREMVRSGMAWAFTKYSDTYLQDEKNARERHAGIWLGSSIPPWQYRAEKWAVAEQRAPDGCPIKGNISKNGRIYHPPWSPWYSRTKVSIEKGEKWFCSEAEAIEAGWRAPRWN